ncbi:MAG: alkaline phosphatase D family protein [Azospirillaceae bacterium]
MDTITPADRAAGAADPDGPSRTGPLLYLRGVEGGRVALTVLLVVPRDGAPPVVETADGPVTGREIAATDGRRVLAFAIDLPMAAAAEYRVDGEAYPVDTAFEGDLRIAFVSCNGQEHDDSDRPLDERDALWRRLGGAHAERPFHLLLHGGDQLYADELLYCHPRVRAWARGKAPPGGPVDDAEAADIEQALRTAFFERYLQLLSQPAIAWLMARVPSLAMWDDHDICDGWGSLAVDKLDSPVGRRLFAVARAHFVTFQLGAAPDARPAICLDETGRSLGWHVALPGLDLIAPDLRSERRPDRVMGEAGWRMLDAALAAARGRRVLLLSSVPALGPRLSWVEALMGLTRRAEKYEDDLRDQWQSRAHRDEWRAFLQRLVHLQAGGGPAVTVLSGEIHLATRGTLVAEPGPIHQLVASGIAHPPPPQAYARGLGLLARLGESPLPDHPIRLHPLPGRRGIYTAQRNYLVLERRDGAWRTWWELEEDGPTPALDL